MGTEQLQHARQLALAARGRVVLTAEDEEVLWRLLQCHASAGAPPCPDGMGSDETAEPGITSGEPCLNYDDFTQVAAECRRALGPAADVYFRASTFLRLARDACGRVTAAAIFRHCTARSALTQLRCELGGLDASGGGSLSPEQLQQWLARRAPLAACAQQLVSAPDWCTAVAARLRLLHGRRGRLPIKDLAASQEVLELIVALHALEAPAGGGGGCGVASAAASAALEALAGEPPLWWAPGAAAALRARFAELDCDGDGLLSQREFGSFSHGTMTQLAIQRLFNHHCTGCQGCGGGAAPPEGGGMDFAAFCAFCAAWEQRHHPAAVRYLFPLLDLRGAGYLEQADLYVCFREVHALWLALGQYAELRVEDVLAEVNDLLQAPDPQRITAADLQLCGAAGTILGLLLDVNLFWEYENREALLQQQQGQQ